MIKNLSEYKDTGATCKWCGKEFKHYDNTYIQHEYDCNTPNKWDKVMKYFHGNNYNNETLFKKLNL